MGKTSGITLFFLVLWVFFTRFPNLGKPEPNKEPLMDANKREYVKYVLQFFQMAGFLTKWINI
jgi:hypothetical protein